MPIPPGRDRDAAEQPRQRPRGERLDDRDLVGRNLERPQREEQHQEDGEAAGERRQREHVPAPREQVDRLAAEALEARAAPRAPARGELALDPAREPRGGVADVVGEAVAVEDEHERGDDDAEDRGADERRRGEERRLRAGDREHEDRHDREGEVRELVPDADERDRARDRLGAEAPAAEDPVPEPAIPTAAPPGATIESAVEAWVIISAGRKRSPGSATIHGGANVADVERGRRDQRDKPLPRDLLDDAPDVAVVGDLRQEVRRR